jgi:hypothetical protein
MLRQISVSYHFLELIYEENIPESKSMSRKYDTPWINEESKIALVKKRKLWKKYRYNKNPKSQFYAKKSYFFQLRREVRNFWGISCEKSRFYAKKSNFFQF